MRTGVFLPLLGWVGPRHLQYGTGKDGGSGTVWGPVYSFHYLAGWVPDTYSMVQGRMEEVVLYEDRCIPSITWLGGSQTPTVWYREGWRKWYCMRTGVFLPLLGWVGPRHLQYGTGKDGGSGTVWGPVYSFHYLAGWAPDTYSMVQGRMEEVVLYEDRCIPSITWLGGSQTPTVWYREGWRKWYCMRTGVFLPLLGWVGPRHLQYGTGKDGGSGTVWGPVYSFHYLAGWVPDTYSMVQGRMEEVVLYEDRCIPSITWLGGSQTPTVWYREGWRKWYCMRTGVFLPLLGWVGPRHLQYGTGKDGGSGTVWGPVYSFHYLAGWAPDTYSMVQGRMEEVVLYEDRCIPSITWLGGSQTPTVWYREGWRKWYCMRTGVFLPLLGWVGPRHLQYGTGKDGGSGTVWGPVYSFHYLAGWAPDTYSMVQGRMEEVVLYEDRCIPSITWLGGSQTPTVWYREGWRKWYCMRTGVFLPLLGWVGPRHLQYGTGKDGGSGTVWWTGKDGGSGTVWGPSFHYLAGWVPDTYSMVQGRMEEVVLYEDRCIPSITWLGGSQTPTVWYREGWRKWYCMRTGVFLPLLGWVGPRHLQYGTGKDGGSGTVWGPVYSFHYLAGWVPDTYSMVQGRMEEVVLYEDRCIPSITWLGGSQTPTVWYGEGWRKWYCMRTGVFLPLLGWVGPRHLQYGTGKDGGSGTVWGPVYSFHYLAGWVPDTYSMVQGRMEEVVLYEDRCIPSITWLGGSQTPTVWYREGWRKWYCMRTGVFLPLLGWVGPRHLQYGTGKDGGSGTVWGPVYSFHYLAGSAPDTYSMVQGRMEEVVLYEDRCMPSITWGGSQTPTVWYREGWRKWYCMRTGVFLPLLGWVGPRHLQYGTGKDGGSGTVWGPVYSFHYLAGWVPDTYSMVQGRMEEVVLYEDRCIPSITWWVGPRHLQYGTGKDGGSGTVWGPVYSFHYLAGWVPDTYSMVQGRMEEVVLYEDRCIPSITWLGGSQTPTVWYREGWRKWYCMRTGVFLPLLGWVGPRHLQYGTGKDGGSGTVWGPVYSFHYLAGWVPDTYSMVQGRMEEVVLYEDRCIPSITWLGGSQTPTVWYREGWRKWYCMRTGVFLPLLGWVGPRHLQYGTGKDGGSGTVWGPVYSFHYLAGWVPDTYSMVQGRMEEVVLYEDRCIPSITWLGGSQTPTVWYHGTWGPVYSFHYLGWVPDTYSMVQGRMEEVVLYEDRCIPSITWLGGSQTPTVWYREGWRKWYCMRTGVFLPLLGWVGPRHLQYGTGKDGGSGTVWGPVYSFHYLAGWAPDTYSMVQGRMEEVVLYEDRCIPSITWLGGSQTPTVWYREGWRKWYCMDRCIPSITWLGGPQTPTVYREGWRKWYCMRTGVFLPLLGWVGPRHLQYGTGKDGGSGTVWGPVYSFHYLAGWVPDTYSMVQGRMEEVVLYEDRCIPSITWLGGPQTPTVWYREGWRKWYCMRTGVFLPLLGLGGSQTPTVWYREGWRKWYCMRTGVFLPLLGWVGPRHLQYGTGKDGGSGTVWGPVYSFHYLAGWVPDTYSMVQGRMEEVVLYEDRCIPSITWLGGSQTPTVWYREGWRKWYCMRTGVFLPLLGWVGPRHLQYGTGKDGGSGTVWGPVYSFHYLAGWVPDTYSMVQGRMEEVVLYEDRCIPSITWLGGSQTPTVWYREGWRKWYCMRTGVFLPLLGWVGPRHLQYGTGKDGGSGTVWGPVYSFHYLAGWAPDTYSMVQGRMEEVVLYEDRCIPSITWLGGSQTPTVWYREGWRKWYCMRTGVFLPLLGWVGPRHLQYGTGKDGGSGTVWGPVYSFHYLAGWVPDTYSMVQGRMEEVVLYEDRCIPSITWLGGSQTPTVWYREGWRKWYCMRTGVFLPLLGWVGPRHLQYGTGKDGGSGTVWGPVYSFHYLAGWVPDTYSMVQGRMEEVVLYEDRCIPSITWLGGSQTPTVWYREGWRKWYCMRTGVFLPLLGWVGPRHLEYGTGKDGGSGTVWGPVYSFHYLAGWVPDTYSMVQGRMEEVVLYEDRCIPSITWLGGSQTPTVWYREGWRKWYCMRTGVFLPLLGPGWVPDTYSMVQGRMEEVVLYEDRCIPSITWLGGSQTPTVWYREGWRKWYCMRTGVFLPLLGWVGPRHLQYGTGKDGGSGTVWGPVYSFHYLAGWVPDTYSMVQGRMEEVVLYEDRCIPSITWLGGSQTPTVWYREGWRKWYCMRTGVFLPLLGWVGPRHLQYGTGKDGGSGTVWGPVYSFHYLAGWVPDTYSMVRGRMEEVVLYEDRCIPSITWPGGSQTPTVWYREGWRKWYCMRTGVFLPLLGWVGPRHLQYGTGKDGGSGTVWGPVYSFHYLAGWVPDTYSMVQGRMEEVVLYEDRCIPSITWLGGSQTPTVWYREGWRKWYCMRTGVFLPLLGWVGPRHLQYGTGKDGGSGTVWGPVYSRNTPVLIQYHFLHPSYSTTSSILPLTTSRVIGIFWFLCLTFHYGVPPGGIQYRTTACTGDGWARCS